MWKTEHVIQRLHGPGLPSKGRIKFQHLECATPMIEIPGTRIQPKASDPFGEISSGVLILSGGLILLGKYTDRLSKDLFHRDDNVRVSLDGARPELGEQIYLLPVSKDGQEHRYWSLLLQRATPSVCVSGYARIGLAMYAFPREQATHSDLTPWRNPYGGLNAYYLYDDNLGVKSRDFTKADFEHGKSYTVTIF